MNNDLTLLASAYLDGDTTPAERVQVDGDPAALVEVERLRRVRAVLAQHDTAPISTRERHIAAAFDVWDRLPTTEFTGDATPAGAQSAAAAGRASITSPTSLSERRQRSSRGNGNGRLLALTAGLIILLGGGIVARGFISSNRDDGSVATEAADTADQELSARAELDVVAADETFADPDEVASELSADDVPASPEAETFGGTESEGPPDEGLEVLASEAELAIFADDLNRTTGQVDVAEAGTASASEPAAGEQPADDAVQVAPIATLPAPFPLCDLVTRIVGPALWKAPGLFDTAVVVGIDDATGTAVAYNPDDCSIVASTPLQP